MIEIDKLIATAMKARNKDELRAYKNLKAEFQKAQTAKDAKPMDDAAELQIITKYCKKLEDAISEFSEAHRDDLALEYRSELEVLKKFLPVPVDESQIRSFIESDENYFDKFLTIIEDYSSGDGTQHTYTRIIIPKKEMGSTIKYLKSKFPTADGKLLSEIVKSYIN